MSPLLLRYCCHRAHSELRLCCSTPAFSLKVALLQKGCLKQSQRAEPKTYSPKPRKQCFESNVASMLHSLTSIVSV